MKTKVVLTVDTEPSIAGAFIDQANSPLLEELVACMVDGKSQGLGFIIDTLAQHNLVGTFFVETVHTRYFPETVMGRYVEDLMQAGQNVELHLHPSWAAFEDGRLKSSHGLNDDCGALPAEMLAALIDAGCAQIERWTGRRPQAMRTGNFSTTLNVFEVMRQAALSCASNICLAVRRPPEPELAVAGGVHDFSGIRELPVTCFADVGPIGRGRLRPMAVTALTAQEQIALLTAAHRYGNSIVVILTHPFEFIKKRDFRYTGLRPNRIVQDRFKGLCGFLADNSDRFEVVPLAVAAEALAPCLPWTGLTGNWLSSIGRAVQNVANDRLHFL